MHAAVLHELVVLLTVLVLIEDLRPDDYHLVGEGGPGHLATTALARTLLALLCEVLESKLAQGRQLVRGGSGACASA